MQGAMFTVNSGISWDWHNTWRGASNEENETTCLRSCHKNCWGTKKKINPWLGKDKQYSSEEFGQTKSLDLKLFGTWNFAIFGDVATCLSSTVQKWWTANNLLGKTRYSWSLASGKLSEWNFDQLLRYQWGNSPKVWVSSVRIQNGFSTNITLLSCLSSHVSEEQHAKSFQSTTIVGSSILSFVLSPLLHCHETSPPCQLSRRHNQLVSKPQLSTRALPSCDWPTQPACRCLGF